MTIPLVTPDELFRFFLLLVRVSAVILTFPLLNSRALPSPFKIVFVVILSMSLYPVVRTQNLLIPQGPIHLGLFVLGEMLVGMLVGFIGQIVFAGLQLGGTLMDTQMGLSLANILDPQNGAQITIIANLQYLMGTLLFLSIQGHHVLIAAMAESLHTIPLLDFNVPISVGRLLVTLMGKAFVMAIRIAAPVIVTLLLTKFAMGIIARMVPQMNIFILSFPLNLGIGLLFLGLALPYVIWGIREWFGEMHRNLFLIIRLMAGG